MNQVYPSFVDGCLSASYDISSDGLTAKMVDGYTFNPAHSVLGDVGSTFFTAQTVTIDHVSGGEVWINGDVVFSSVPTGNTLTGVVFYLAGATGSPLVCFVDRRADTVPLGLVTNDGDITFTFARLLKL